MKLAGVYTSIMSKQDYNEHHPMLDMKTGEQAVEYGQKTEHQPLVSELWAICGHCDEVRAQKIAKRAKLPIQWFDKTPALNGTKGIEKLRAERGVLLLRNRTSDFIDQFQHPIGSEMIAALKADERIPDGRIETIDYGKDYVAKKKSYIAELIDLFSKK